MTEREALLRAVCANPDDDTPRLVFADWLDENGEPERAEFIRLQVRLAELLRLAASGTDVVANRARELGVGHGMIWRRELPPINGVEWHDAFFRGFVERAVVASDALLMHHADVIFGQAPLRYLVIRQFDAVEGFADLGGLRHLKTLSLTNLQATEGIVRHLCGCNPLSESMLLWCHFGQTGSEFYTELHTKFGDRLMLPVPPPPPRTPGDAYRGARQRRR
jgi:uncharacterized protein (TIGR02996 family)